jgi:hypothetical protein
MTPETWVKILYLYGPMALFVIMTFVLLGKAKPGSGLPPRQQLIQTIAYSAVWASIFILGAIIVVVWWRINLPREFQIKGAIHDLRYSETITSTDNLFLRRVYKTPLNIDYEWRILSSSPISEPVQFLLQDGNDTSRYLRYKIPPSPELYKSNVEISYERTTRRMKLADEKFSAVLEPEILTSADIPRQEPSLASTVYADDTPSPEELVKALDANDPIVRQNVKRALVTMGTKSAKTVEAAAQNPANSLRMRTEALSVLEKVVGVKTISKSGWRPIELSYNAKLGIFALGFYGDVSKIYFDSAGSHSLEIFKLPGLYQPVSMASDENAVYVAARSSATCTLWKYVVATKELAQKAVVGLKACSAVASDGIGLYVAGELRGNTSLLHWSAWDAPTQDDHSWPDLTVIGTLHFDQSGNRLLIGDSSAGLLHSVAIPSFQKVQLASNLGWINSITSDDLRILVASGKKILLLNSKTGAGQNPPASLRGLHGGHLSGVILDLAGSAWVSDYDRDSITGPIPFN